MWANRATIAPRTILRSAGLLVDRGAWLDADRLLGCAYPRRDGALAALAAQGVSVLINLHRRPHRADRLARHGLTEVHLPVADFTAPSPEQIARGVEAIEAATGAGRRVAVHSGGGLGRTGTLLACWLVHRGAGADEAIRRVRTVRPGSIETAGQVAAVHAFADHRGEPI